MGLGSAGLGKCIHLWWGQCLQPQPLLPYGIFHLSAESINFISCLLDGKSRAGASFPVNQKQQ